MLITIGDGSILLKDAKGKTLNIETVAPDPKRIILTPKPDTYNNTVEGVTILALGGSDSVSNSGADVSIDAGDGLDTVDGFKADSTLLTDGAFTLSTVARMSL